MAARGPRYNNEIPGFAGPSPTEFERSMFGADHSLQAQHGKPDLLRYDTNIHGYGQRLQKLDPMAAMIGEPIVTEPFRGVESEYGYGGSCLPRCCPQPRSDFDEQGWEWSPEGKLKLTCTKPVVTVPVIQEIHRRDKIIEIPQLEVVDAIQPKVYNQDVQHQIPKLQIQLSENELEIPTLRYIDKEIIIPVVTGYTHKFVPKWEIREVPRPVVKYVGKQEIIEVEVPKIEFVDKVVSKEVVVDTVEKKVPKITEKPNYIDTVKYVWKPVEKIVHVERIVPKFDVSLDCPAPLLVPYTVQNVKEMPSVLVRKPRAETDNSNMATLETVHIPAPAGTVRVAADYIKDHIRVPKQPSNNLANAFSCCCQTEQENFTVPDAHPSVAAPTFRTVVENMPTTEEYEERQQNAVNSSSA